MCLFYTLDFPANKLTYKHKQVNSSRKKSSFLKAKQCYYNTYNRINKETTKIEHCDKPSP